MEYDWDPVKAVANFLKHEVRFVRIREFDWETAKIGEDRRRDYGETRFIGVGPIDGITHVAIFTFRGTQIRLISLRRANDRERRRHERT